MSSFSEMEVQKQEFDIKKKKKNYQELFHQQY